MLEMSDPYIYSDTDTLKNKLSIKDEKLLKRKEDAIYTLYSQDALAIALNSKKITFQTFCNIHKTLFSELYSWAGKPRECEMNKGNTVFCLHHYIEKQSNEIFTKLHSAKYFKKINNVKEYATKLASVYGDVNAIHPFREGNGRSQKILFQGIVAKSDYTMRWEKISSKEHIESVIDEAKGKPDKLIAVFAKGLEKSSGQNL